MPRNRPLLKVTLGAITLSHEAIPAAAQQPGADRTQALLGLGRVKRDAGDFVAARRYFDDARKLRPFNSSELVEFFWIVARGISKRRTKQ